MEAFAQGKQREITLESFALVNAARTEVQCFNELLVMYARPKRKKLEKVVPDNLVVLHPEPIRVRGSFRIEFQPCRPFLVLEYVSKYSKRKDYDDNHRRYERELRVPYYVLFYPDNEELTVFRMGSDRYAAVIPVGSGRLPIPELELEVALLDGWVRFWFRGELLPLPADLLNRLQDTERRLTAAQQVADAERQTRLAAELRASSAEAEVARLREELARAKGTQP
jgi:Uma2 family endonuclease